MGLLDPDEDGTDSRVPRHSRRRFCQYLRHRYPAWRSKQEERDVNHEHPVGHVQLAPRPGLGGARDEARQPGRSYSGVVGYDSLTRRSGDYDSAGDRTSAKDRANLQAKVKLAMCRRSLERRRVKSSLRRWRAERGRRHRSRRGRRCQESRSDRAGWHGRDRPPRQREQRGRKYRPRNSDAPLAGLETSVASHGDDGTRRAKPPLESPVEKLNKSKVSGRRFPAAASRMPRDRSPCSPEVMRGPMVDLSGLVKLPDDTSPATRAPRAPWW